MNNLFAKLLEKHQLSPEEIDRHANRFSKVVLVTLWGASSKRLTPEDYAQIRMHLYENNFNHVLPMIESKYTPEEWQEILEKHVSPLLDNFLKNIR